MSATDIATRATVGEAQDGRRWVMLAVLLLGQFMGLIDALIVNVAIAIGLALAALSVVLERRIQTRGGDPLLNLDVLRTKNLSSGLVTLFCTLTQVTIVRIAHDASV